MPIRQQLFLLVKLGKNVGYAYRARAVEAIRLYRTLEQQQVLVARSTKDKNDVVHNNKNQLGTVQHVQQKNSHKNM